MLPFWSLAELFRCGVEGTLMTEIKSVAHKILNENVVGILTGSLTVIESSITIQTIQYIFSLFYCYFV